MSNTRSRFALLGFGLFFICVLFGIFNILNVLDESPSNTTQSVLPPFVSGSTYTVVETFVIGDTIDRKDTTKWVLSESESYYGYITISRVENAEYYTVCVIPLKYMMRGVDDVIIRTGRFNWHVIDYGYNWVKLGHN